MVLIAAVSLEVLQLSFAGRTTSVNDLISSTLGGGIGLALSLFNRITA